MLTKDVLPSVKNWVVIGLMAVTFIVLAKWLVTKWPVPYVTPVINAV